MRLFLTGATGLVGRRLVRAAGEAGHQVCVVSRSADRARQTLPPSVTVIEGDPTQAGLWQKEAPGCDAVVNLAGENIFARRWSAEFKAVLHSSRVEVTRRVVEVFGTGDGRARVLVNASAVGYYGDSEGVTFCEDSSPGSGPLPDLCVAWEAEARKAAEHGARVVLLRIGVVLDPAGGALGQMLPPFRKFVGGPVGSGRQYMSWIHAGDLCRLILFALETESLSGPVNATAPHPVTNREFSKTLGRVLGRPSFCKVPRFVMKLVLGEVADVVVKGQRVLPTKAQQAGFEFTFPGLEDALRDLL